MQKNSVIRVALTTLLRNNLYILRSDLGEIIFAELVVSFGKNRFVMYDL